MTVNLTDEQYQVIKHPRGKHARVLAVAGSGKTTTMAYRVQHLVQDLGVDPRRIRILMFNKLARVQFQEKFEKINLPLHLRPQVNTFHSYSYRVIKKMIETGMHPPFTQEWIEDKAELARMKMHEALRNLVKRGEIYEGEIDIDEITDAISLWKGALIPPNIDRAGYHGNNKMPLVYIEFEKIRIQERAITFDDFVPLAVDLLQQNAAYRQELGSCDFVIADEYQDVNYGQQRLIELLAGERADVMVVGDDDQVIYEWRGARPNYILQDFQQVFNNKPHTEYKLSRSFRFGPELAQCAANVIVVNGRRIQKQLVASQLDQKTSMHIFVEHSEQSTNPHKDMAQQAAILIREYGEQAKAHKKPLDLRDKIIVLGRLFAQMDQLETEFLKMGIPYRVVGKQPFFERHEVQTLLHYIWLAARLNQKMTRKWGDTFMSVLNMPNRKLAKQTVKQAIDGAITSGDTALNVLQKTTDPYSSLLSRDQRDRFDALTDLMQRLGELIAPVQQMTASFVLDWLVTALNYREHFENYYGKGEDSYDRWMTVMSFISYAGMTGLFPLDFLDHVAKLDTTRGMPEAQQIVLTTVYRTKGLEYENVFIPNCNEGYMPFTYSTPNQIYDNKGIVREQAPSDVIENERRLYYVAITRGIKQVFISTSQTPMQGQQGDSQGSKPSRFLIEMEWEATQSLLGAFQKMYAGDQNGRAEMLAHAKRFGGSKKAINGLIRDYLTDLGDARLISEVERVASAVPENKRQAIPANTIHQTPEEPEPPSQEWWESL